VREGRPRWSQSNARPAFAFYRFFRREFLSMLHVTR
jgi:hypothetical protein